MTAAEMGGHEGYGVASNPVTTIEKLEQFIETRPPTIGRFESSMDLSEPGRPDGLYISPDVGGMHEDDLPQVEALLLLPGAEICAADSHHQVAVADAAVTYGGQTVTITVAVKPFSTESRGAEFEHDAYLEARRRGFDSYKPLGLAKDGNDTYLITEWRSDVTTLDNEDWSISPEDPRFETEVSPNLTFIARGIAQMHVKGIAHEDAQPKNIARTDTGGLTVIDLENAHFAHDEEELVAMINGEWDVTESKALSDVWHCWYAMIHPMTGAEDKVVFLDGESVEVCMEVFEHQILDPYLAELISVCSPTVVGRLNVSALRSALLERVRNTT